MRDRLRDDRSRYYFQVDNIVMEKYLPLIGHTPFAVYSYLLYRAGQSEVAWPSYSAMQKGLGMGRAQVANAVRVLTEHGLITVTHGKSEHARQPHNIYHIVDLTGSESELVPKRNQFQIGTRTSSESEPELVPNRNSNYTQRTIPREQDPKAAVAAGARAPAHALAHARETRNGDGDGVSIPADLSPGDDERAQMQTLGIPQQWYFAKWWSIVEHYENKPNDQRTIEKWRWTCRHLISEDWAKSLEPRTRSR